MTPNEYQEAAMRTRAPQEVVIERLWKNPELIALLHACIGLAGEVGELATAIQRWLWYGKGDFDKVNGIEEFGDVTWYTAEGIEALGGKLEDVLLKNIAKLAKRYPAKFTEFLAAEENRDRWAEREILESNPEDPEDAYVMDQMSDKISDGLVKLKARYTNENVKDNCTTHENSLKLTGAIELARLLRGDS